jgi:hypothetical protein
MAICAQPRCYPDDGLTVIALTNGEHTDIDRIAHGVAPLYGH